MTDNFDLFGDGAKRTPRRGSTARDGGRGGRASRGMPSGMPAASSASFDSASYDDSLIPNVFTTIPGASPESAVAIGSLTETAKAVVEGALAPLWVRGEVCDFKRHRNGHWYFSLRDATAQLRCVVWSRDQRRIPAAPDEGMEVVAYGQLTVYPARGDLHFTVTRMDAHGDGLWRKAMEETRLRLERDGLLDPARKRPLPFAPRRIAVVTSQDGAAIRDIIAVVGRRAPDVRIILCPAKVQGDGAAEEICEAMARVARWNGADLLIVGRGGGAREDLWVFNDERIARAIAASPIPVISAVGHEIDITLADLVADLRAATPSAAAEAAVPLRDDLLRELRVCRDAMAAAVRMRVDAARSDIRHVATSLVRVSTRQTERRRATLSATAGRLDALSPLGTLARGYTVARSSDDGRTMSSIADFAEGDAFQLTVRDGTVDARAIGVRPASVEE